MKVTLEHHRTKKEVMESVDRSFGDMFKGVEGLPVKVAVKEKSWQGSTLNFALTAKMGLLSTPITGTHHRFGRIAGWPCAAMIARAACTARSTG